MTGNGLCGGVVSVDDDLATGETDMADHGAGIEDVEIGAVRGRPGLATARSLIGRASDEGIPVSLASRLRQVWHRRLQTTTYEVLRRRQFAGALQG